MHIYTGLKTFKLWLDNKRGDIPGWGYIVGLIIGLFVLLVAIYIAIRSGQKGTGIIEEVFG